MNNLILPLGLLTVTLIGAVIHAWRSGTERRDVALLGVAAGLFGAGTAVAAVV